MDKDHLYNLVRYAAIAGNLIFIAWVTYNGIDEGFKGTLPQIVSYVALTVLLLANVALLCRRKD